MTSVVRLRNVLIPTGSRRSAGAGVAMLTFSKPVPLACHRLLYALVALAGPFVLPGRRSDWSPPDLPPEVSSIVGPIEELAVYERPQASRSGLAIVMLRAGRPVAFLKLRNEVVSCSARNQTQRAQNKHSEPLERERVALAAFCDVFEPESRSGLRVPRVLGHGGDWLLLEAMPPRPTRPWPNPPIQTITAEIRDALEKALPRPSGTPSHWVPMHGDLTAWNLRAVGRERWLIDWEDAAWGPPGADRAYYAATSSAVFGTPPGRAERETVEFWLERVAARPTTDHDAALAGRLMSVLRAMSLQATSLRGTRG